MAEKIVTETAQAEVKAKTTQVSCVLSPEELEALEDYRWANRIDKRSDVVKIALTEFLNRG